MCQAPCDETLNKLVRNRDMLPFIPWEFSALRPSSRKPLAASISALSRLELDEYFMHDSIASSMHLVVCALKKHGIIKNHMNHKALEPDHCQRWLVTCIRESSCDWQRLTKDKLSVIINQHDCQEQRRNSRSMPLRRNKSQARPGED